MPLTRQLGLFGASMMGLGAILGTGVFVSIGIAAGIAGPAVVVAIALAALVATCNALSSAQLAASHPVSGGTYEYGYRYLNPMCGFAAGWLFLCAKSASAASAALGFAGYLLTALGGESAWLVHVALATVVVLTLVVLAGIQRSSQVNIAIVTVTLLALVAFIVGGVPHVTLSHLAMTFHPPSLLEATALMFVAYTGYGRIATLGEEVRNPEQIIPRAIIATLVVSMLLYIGVALVGVGAAGAERIERATTAEAAPLEVVAREFALPVHHLVAIGAMTALLGVLLNLILGLSRVMIAMGRRGDMPGRMADVRVAIVAVAVVIAGLAATGNVKMIWTFSAFTVLVYYAVTNLAALQLSPAERLYPRILAWGGLAACLALAFAIEPRVWMAGLGVLGVGLVWHLWRQKGQR